MNAQYETKIEARLQNHRPSRFKKDASDLQFPDMDIEQKQHCNSFKSQNHAITVKLQNMYI